MIWLFEFFVWIGTAIKCYVCSSLYDKSCEDGNFNGNPEFMYDCSMDPGRIIPVLHCRKAKYLSKLINKLLLFLSISDFNALLLNFVLVNNEWVYVRSCNKRDNLTQAKDAEVNLCHANYCNSGIKFDSNILIMLFAMVSMCLNFLRVWMTDKFLKKIF